MSLLPPPPPYTHTHQVTEERDCLPTKPPLLVKIAPDLSDKDKEDIAAVIMRETVSQECTTSKAPSL